MKLISTTSPIKSEAWRTSSRTHNTLLFTSEWVQHQTMMVVVINSLPPIQYNKRLVISYLYYSIKVLSIMHCFSSLGVKISSSANRSKFNDAWVTNPDDLWTWNERPKFGHRKTNLNKLEEGCFWIQGWWYGSRFAITLELRIWPKL